MLKSSMGADALNIVGRGLHGSVHLRRPLDAGNSGTTMRMMAGMLAAQPFRSAMTGDESLSRRPMRRVIEPLALMGARIEATDGHAPLIVHGTTLHPIAYTRRAERPGEERGHPRRAAHDGTTSVTEPAETRDHTERALEAFGFDVDLVGLTVSVRGGQAVTVSASGARRFFVGGVLDGGGRGAPRFRSHHRRCRAEPDPNRADRRAAPFRRARRGPCHRARRPANRWARSS